MITKTSLGKGPTLYLGFVEGPIFIADLMGPRTLGDVEPLLHTMGCSNMVSDETAFHARWLVTKAFLLTFMFFQVMGLVFCDRREEPIV